PLSIHVVSNQYIFRGYLTGYVQDNGVDANDPGSQPFTDYAYGGLATVTVTPSVSGGYDIVFAGDFNQSFSTEESFSVGHFQLQGHLASLNFTFDLNMNNHCKMHGAASLSGNAIQGT